MNVYNVLLFIVSVASVSTEDDDWRFSEFADFFKDQTKNIKDFFEEQKHQLEIAVNTSYEKAIKVKEIINNYVDDQKKMIRNQVNSYIASVKEKGRKISSTRSHVPIIDNSRHEEVSDSILSVPAIISRNGYVCETHTVMSQGYFLNIHRIPSTKKGGTISSNTVLLQHGLFASSADWILSGPEKALAYVLADAGYDVWMANMRGNKYSKEHSWWSLDSKEYWNFSWHDVALYDVPAIIDYILKTKGENTKISYIGYSMGATILFAMLSLRPEYNAILNSGIALGPIVFMTSVTSPLISLSPVVSNFAYMEMMYGSHEFIPKHSTLGSLTKSCEAEHMDTTICNHIIFYICGYVKAQFNKTLLPVFLSHSGTGTSWKTLFHFAQEIVSGGKFQMFDYGSYYNQKIYGSETPPEYDLSKVTLPITVFWAKNDLLSSETNVKMLHDKLPDTTKMYLVPHPEFNHLDYLWSIDAPKLVNEKILSTLHEAFKDKPTIFNVKSGLNSDDFHNNLLLLFLEFSLCSF